MAGDGAATARLEAQWTASARELIRNGERELVERAGRLAREVLALIAQGNGGGEPSPAT